MKPAWQTDALDEPWPQHQLDYGAFPASDFDAQSSSNGSVDVGGGTGLKSAQGTLIQHDVPTRGSARAPLAALPSASRSMFDKLPLEALFHPPSQDEREASKTAPFAFDFECPTAVRIQPEQRGVSTSPLAAKGPAQENVPLFNFDSPDPSQQSGLEQPEEVEEDGMQLSVTRDDVTKTSPAKRMRLDPEAEEQEMAEHDTRRNYLAAFVWNEQPRPSSAVRDRIQARRDGRRSSLPASFEIAATPDRPIRHSLPATMGPINGQALGASNRQTKAATVMQQVRSQEPFFTPVRAPMTRRESVPPPTVGPNVLEAVPEDEEGEQESFQDSPFARPAPPTPERAHAKQPYLASLLTTDRQGLPLTPRKPQDDALAASAVDEMFVPSPPPLSDDNAQEAPAARRASPEQVFMPKSALKRPAAEMDSPKAASPRVVSFDHQARAFVEGHAGIINFGRHASALRHELEQDDSAATTQEYLEPIAPVQGNPLQLSKLGEALDQLASSGPSELAASARSSVFAASHGLKASQPTIECSFSVAREALVGHITSVEPYEPSWSGMLFIDLSKRQLKALVGMKDMLPGLEELILDDNAINHLTGISEGLRAVGLARNDLSDATSFGVLQRLERLDISDNGLTSLKPVSCLRSLKELKADRNQINSIDGLQGLSSLVKLSLRNNNLRNFEAQEHLWPEMQNLDLAGNQIASFAIGERTCDSLIFLNLDSNELAGFSTFRPCPTLRTLRISRNPLQAIQLQWFTGLRTLFVDETRLRSLGGIGKLSRLEHLSVRTVQTRRDTSLPAEAFRDLRRVYLSGQSINWRFAAQPCFNLVYLELVMCRLTSLPAHMATSLPNCRSIALDYNSLEDISPLAGMQLLGRLTMQRNQIASCEGLISLLQSLPEIKVIDIRGNPCAAPFYLQAPLPSMPADAHHAMHGVTIENKPTNSHDALNADAWREADQLHLRSLPERAYFHRTLWRCLAYRAASTLVHLDGLPIVGEASRGQKLIDRLGKSGELDELRKGL